MAGAYRVIDRRGSSNGRQSLPVFQTNNLYPAATPNSDRRSVPSLDYDGYNLVTPTRQAKSDDLRAAFNGVKLGCQGGGQ